MRGIIGRLRRPFWYAVRFPHTSATRKSCPDGRFARSLVVGLQLYRLFEALLVDGLRDVCGRGCGGYEYIASSRLRGRWGLAGDLQGGVE